MVESTPLFQLTFGFVWNYLEIIEFFDKAMLFNLADG